MTKATTEPNTADDIPDEPRKLAETADESGAAPLDDRAPIVRRGGDLASGVAGDCCPSPSSSYVIDVWDDHCVVRQRDDYYSVPYTLNQNPAGDGDSDADDVTFEM